MPMKYNLNFSTRFVVQLGLSSTRRVAIPFRLKGSGWKCGKYISFPEPDGH